MLNAKASSLNARIFESSRATGLGYSPLGQRGISRVGTHDNLFEKVDPSQGARASAYRSLRHGTPTLRFRTGSSADF